MRKLLLTILFVAIVVYVISIFLDTKMNLDQSIITYYIQNFYQDTHAKNGVTAIYLNYRVFDSIFETLILLASATAVISFSRRQENE
ncbi:hypothetical protein I5677_00405 [Mobilitalea sibirica]|uniref:Multicomponent Na+:H+ antiporter subunit B n=1 Tax=Mobilitalea sibirica TaxID=1462919 RepID=A0A8J7H070_9FIRM|nr:hypothetical protein [Mobilitalea sibirica]MBH1939347.1 hypothetical protein [Mobilitalea sibirica]